MLSLEPSSTTTTRPTPASPAAFARYNLACYHALNGDLDAARALLRQALPADEALRTLAPNDNDLVALRNELPAISARLE